MVKPALPYLDIVIHAYDRFEVPIAAQNGGLGGERMTIEEFTSIKRASASLVLTNFAKHAARLL